MLRAGAAVARGAGTVTGMEQHVLVRFYHEIALKGGNRPWFLKHMGANLRRALAGTGVGKIRWNAMMASFPLRDEEQWELVRSRLEELIGVERFSRAISVEPTMDAMKEAIPGLIEGQTPETFRIAARRADKRFPMTSPEINHALGRHVQDLTGWPVDLKDADLTLYVQTTEREALLSAESLPGPGGMPVGVGGHVAALLSGGIDSPVAAYQMMRRGCKVTFVHFHSFPLVEGTSREKAEELVELLTHYQQSSRLLLVPFAGAQQRIIVTVPPAYRVAVYRRFMVRIAEALAVKHGAAALVTGDSLGQVSSQTLENLTTIGAAAERLPLFRPLLTMDKGEIIDIARPLGTYPISIIPDQDCCSLFVPRHPVIKSRIQDVERMEAELPVEELVKAALEAVEERVYHWPPAAAKRGTDEGATAG
ncbi:MAG: tRNA 4-thiouridine(8) synthase ThiI [Chloroflexi bacterium]|nr:tRNA 4-thiouridine(8) synthase ThiI [Chloroflexota bacterium]